MKAKGRCQGPVCQAARQGKAKRGAWHGMVLGNLIKQESRVKWEKAIKCEDFSKFEFIMGGRGKRSRPEYYRVCGRFLRDRGGARQVEQSLGCQVFSVWRASI